MENAKKFSSTVLRLGLGLVVIWFGLQQIGNPEPWTGVLPDWTNSLPISQINLVNLNAWFELITGTLLIVGFYTRTIALILSIHLLSIVSAIGYNATGVRDFGLAFAMFALFLQGAGAWSIDDVVSKKIETIS